MLTEQEAEEFRIRQLVEKWALTRDAGDWDGFASVWHAGGWMTATWFQGPAAGFIMASREGYGIAPRLPGLRGPEVERLYQEGRDWRGGSAAPGVATADGLLSPAGPA